MKAVPLFASIDYERPASYGEDFLGGLSQWFYLGGRRAKVLQGNEVSLEDKERLSYYKIALKVTSYVLLLPLTLMLLAVHLALRHTHRFTVIYPSSSGGMGIDPSQSRSHLMMDTTAQKIDQVSLQSLAQEPNPQVIDEPEWKDVLTLFRQNAEKYFSAAAAERVFNDFKLFLPHVDPGLHGEILQFIQKVPTLPYFFRGSDIKDPINSLEDFQNHLIQRFQNVFINLPRSALGTTTTPEHLINFRFACALAENTSEHLWEKIDWKGFDLIQLIESDYRPFVRLCKKYRDKHFIKLAVKHAIDRFILRGDREGLALVEEFFPHVLNKCLKQWKEGDGFSNETLFPSMYQWLVEKGVIKPSTSSFLSSEVVSATQRERDVSMYGGAARHQIYQARQKDAISWVTSTLKDPSFSFASIIQRLGGWRQSIALKTGAPAAYAFGSFREGDLKTVVQNTLPNAVLYAKMAALVNQQCIIKFRAPNGGICQLPLTSIHYENNGSKLKWRHTSRRALLEMIFLLESMYKKLGTAKYDSTNDKGRTELLQHVGLFHWCWAHACPYHRGSAAIGEVLVMAMLQHHGIAASVHSEAERIALATWDLHQFTAEYPSYLRTHEGEPIQVSGQADNGSKSFMEIQAYSKPIVVP